MKEILKQLINDNREKIKAEIERAVRENKTITGFNVGKFKTSNGETIVIRINVTLPRKKVIEDLIEL